MNLGNCRQLCSLLLGVLIKLSFVALAAPAIVVLVVSEWRKQGSYGLEKGFKLLALPVLALLLLASGGMNLADGWHYIAGPNREIVSGYSEAMALYFRANNWQQWPYWLCSAGAIAMAVIGLRRRWQWRQPLGTAALVLGGLLFFWAPMVLSMQITMLVNSAVHIWGDEPYEDAMSEPCTAKNNAFLFWPMLGENWHNTVKFLCYIVW